MAKKARKENAKEETGNEKEKGVVVRLCGADLADLLEDGHITMETDNGKVKLRVKINDDELEDVERCMVILDDAADELEELENEKGDDEEEEDDEFDEDEEDDEGVDGETKKG